MHILQYLRFSFICIFGIRAILEAIHSEKPIDKVWLLKGTQSKLFEQLLHKLREVNKRAKKAQRI